MKELNMENSAICQEYSFNLMEKYLFSFSPEIVPSFYRVVFFTIANVLKSNKSKAAGKTAFALKDLDGNFKFGAIATYHNPEDDNEDDDKGNYTIEFTLNEKDLEGISSVYDNHSDTFIYTVGIQAQEIANMRIKTMEYANKMFTEAIDTLVSFLDANVTEDENEVCFVYPGIFTATCSIEDGEKVIDIIPGEMIRQVIKDDSNL